MRIKVIKKENGGVTSARLVGVQQATGEFIGFVDGDDIIESDMYERLLKMPKTIMRIFLIVVIKWCYKSVLIFTIIQGGLCSRISKMV